MAGALALAVAATVVLVCLNAGTRSELLQEPAPEARRSEILAMNRELNLQQNLLDVAVRNAISAARKAGGAAGDAEKETLTQSLSSLPTDSAPNFAMIKSNWKSFSALPPSKRPGFGSAESSSDMDARIARLRAHQVDRDFERSAAAPTTQLSSSPHSPPPLSSPHSTRGMAGAAGAAGGVLVTGFVPAWRPWELCAVGAGARPDNNARLCSAFRSLGDAGEDGEGPASGGVSGVRFEPASGPVGAALAQVPEGARRATERLSAALKPLNTAQAKINLERLALARTMLDFNPYDFEAGGHT
ncbi:hypothetical protein T484DRAFT_1816568 [Baffinella frigidus]|nr:hypothetical protein T484DRAFT_1816568 [Cryptophyta sp. CCMP2293]